MTNIRNIKSPLTNSNNVLLERTIKTSYIIEKYKNSQVHLDVSKYFKDLKEIYIYRCLDTGYRFYYPHHINGDGEFYKQLEKNLWYYMDWKWEHEEIRHLIQPKYRVLEIGCGRGSFLQKIQRRGIKCAGLELNKSAVAYGKNKKLKILNISIQDYAKKNYQKYDIVCSFQVVEHIAKIKEFLQASIHVLKPGGKLIISVPNNDSFIFESYKDIPLNLPPHHMGLWNMNSLIKLEKFFDVRLDEFLIEPLQEYHLGYARLLIEKKLYQEFRNKYGFLASYILNPVKPLILIGIKEMAKYLPGQSIIAVYIKI